MCAVEMVIPRFRSSGALSIAPYARKFASPFSACLFVIAAVNVVYDGVSFQTAHRIPKYVPCRDRHDQLCLQTISNCEYSFDNDNLPMLT